MSGITMSNNELSEKDREIEKSTKLYQAGMDAARKTFDALEEEGLDLPAATYGFLTMTLFKVYEIREFHLAKRMIKKADDHAQMMLAEYLRHCEHLESSEDE